jgi:hypothetical protein
MNTLLTRPPSYVIKWRIAFIYYIYIRAHRPLSQKICQPSFLLIEVRRGSKWEENRKKLNKGKNIKKPSRMLSTAMAAVPFVRKKNPLWVVNPARV